MNKIPCKNTVEWYKTLTGTETAGECLKAVMPSIISLQNRVRKSEYIVDEIPVLSYAAALLAMYRASLCIDTFGLDSFKAGDITVKTTQKEDREHIMAALNLAFCDARPYLKSGLVFKGMDGGSK